MGTGHSHPLYLERDSVVHRLAPEVKIVCSVAVTVAVVLTPREQLWAFSGYALLLLAVAALARVRPGWLAARMLIEVPFVLLAVVLPFTGDGERVDWWGLSLTVEGLYGGWNIVVKGTLGVVSSLLLAATTPARDLLVGMQRLRTPGVLVQIATFMLRYVEVVAGQARRMRIGRLARGDDPRFAWQLRATAASVGTLFLRSYERGERVYLAMLSRGYAGRLPAYRTHPASPGQWAASLTVPAAAAVLLAVALM